MSLHCGWCLQLHAVPLNRCRRTLRQGTLAEPRTATSVMQACAQHYRAPSWTRPGRPSSSRARVITTQATHSCHYTVLGVHEAASEVDIKAAFRQLAKQLHPDVNTQPGANEQFKRVKDAYETLSDPRARAAYDQQRLMQARRSSSRTTSTSTSSSSRGGRSSYYTVNDVIFEVMDEEDVPDDMAGFWAWAQASSGSWQSSWQANSNKQRRRQQQQAAAAASSGSGRGQREGDDKRELQQMLAQLDEGTMAGLKAVFGPRLQQLNSKEDLISFLQALDDLHAEYEDQWEEYVFDTRPPRGRRGRGGTTSTTTTTRSSSSSSRTGSRTTTHTTTTTTSSSSSSSSSSSRTRSGPRQASTTTSSSNSSRRHATANTSHTSSSVRSSGGRASSGASSSSRGRRSTTRSSSSRGGHSAPEVVILDGYDLNELRMLGADALREVYGTDDLELLLQLVEMEDDTGVW